MIHICDIKAYDKHLLMLTHKKQNNVGIWQCINGHMYDFVYSCSQMFLR